MRTTYITALVIAVIVTIWLLSGQINQPKKIMPEPLSVQNSELTDSQSDTPLTRIRAIVMHAQEKISKITVRGQTQNKRTVVVKSETKGRIISRSVERGDQVAKGTLLCQLAVDDRKVAVLKTEAELNHAKIDYQGSLKLQKRNLQSATDIASVKAKLARATADAARAELELARTEIRAPFAGLVENTHVENGDYIQQGAGCITLIDLDPMLLVGQVAERNVHKLKLNATAIGTLSNGQILEGNISFIGSKSDENTRTYTIEVEIPNADLAIKSGYTAQIVVNVGRLSAHKVSPALLSLDDIGNIGIRTVNAQNRVEFHPVDIIEDDPSGIWVVGLPATTTLITVGQELVVPGEEVKVVFEATGGFPASSPVSSEDKSFQSAIKSSAQPSDKTSGRVLATDIVRSSVASPGTITSGTGISP